MSDEKNPLEQAVDQAVEAFVYAPIGLLFDGPALFPKLVERGKSQVNVARMMGQMAVQMGQTEAGKRLASTQGPLRDALETIGLVEPVRPPAAAPAPDSPAERVVAKPTAAQKATTSARDTADKAARTAKKASGTATKTASRAASAASKATKSATKATASATKVTASAAAGAIGIPDYDSLSASQVVTRLRGLAPKELDAVKAYEGATRARKTILNRVAQLQKG